MVVHIIQNKQTTWKQVKYMNCMLYFSELGKTNAFSYPSIKDISFFSDFYDLHSLKCIFH